MISGFGSVLRMYTDPAQALTAARDELHDLDHDLFDISGLSAV